MSQSTLLKKLAVSLFCATSLASGVALGNPIALGTVYTFDLTSSSKLGSGVLGTVTLTQHSVSRIDVSVAPARGGYFASTGVGPAFDFNLSAAYGTSATAINLLGATSTGNFIVNRYAAPGNTSDSYDLTPYGVFTNSIALVGSGASGQISGPLTFDIVTTTPTGISLNDFATSTAYNNGQKGGYAFGVDMFYGGKTGSAGFLGATPTTIATPPDTSGGTGQKNLPEPASLALMGLGLMGVASLRKRGRG